MRKTQIVNSDKLVYLYDLDVIISVGYRVRSNKRVIFRKWATNVPAINKYIRNIIFENELEESSTISKMEIV